MAGSIICGVDDSQPSRGAVRTARRLSTALALPLVLVHVVEESAGAEATRADEGVERLLEAEAGQSMLAERVVEAGHPVDRLVAIASERRAALVVVGSHGSRSSLLGSVSAELSRRAPCPVVVVPPGSEVALAAAWPGSTVAADVARFGLGPASDTAPALAGRGRA